MMTELHDAAASGDLERVNALLGTPVGQEMMSELNAHLEYPLQSVLVLPAHYSLALKAIKAAIFKKFLDLRPELVTHPNQAGDTVLHHIAAHGYDELLEPVLETPLGHTLLSKPNLEGNCPIHTAVLNDRMNIVKQLMKKPGVAELKDGKGQIPLHLVVQNGTIDMVMKCYQAFQDGLNENNSSGQTPLDLAQFNHPDVQAFLRSQGGIAHFSEEMVESYVSRKF